MKNLKVSAKLIFSFSLVIILTTALAEMGLWGMKQIRDASDDMYDFNVTAVDIIGLIRENFASQRYITRELIIYDSDTDEYRQVKEELRKREDEMEAYMEQYLDTILTEDDRQYFSQFQGAYYGVFAPYKIAFMQLTDENQVDAVMELIRTKGKALVDDISEMLQKSHDFNALAAVDAMERNNRLYITLRNAELGILAGVVLCVILLIIRLRNLIAAPLNRISGALDYMSTTGDLTLDDTMIAYCKETSTRKDEIGKASLAIYKLLDHIWAIERVMSQISDGDFSAEIQSLSDKDTLGLSVSKVADNLDRMIQSLKDAEETALKASKAKSTFLSHVSHEIRTPLNAITGMAAVAKNAAGDTKKTAACIEQIMVSSRHLISILNDVLDMSKIESGKLALAAEPFNLRAVLVEVCGIISQSCADKNISFTKNLEKIRNVALIGDKTRLNQVLLNLLGNAVKFTPGGGQISCIIEEIDSEKQRLHYRFTIADSGIGMNDEQMAKLFLPFEQTKADIAVQYGGTGLGLSISQSLVKMMGGYITVESEPNVGTSFAFELSFAISEKALEKPAPAPAAVDLCGNRILLAEDVEINRVIIHEILAPVGLEIEEAVNGKEALELFENSPAGHYALILMDIQMPEMDGHECARRIRALDRPDAKTVPIIAMTANAYKEDVSESLAAGMNDHLAKPLDVDLLMETMMEYVLN